MKTVLFALMLALVAADSMDHSNGKDILKDLQGNNNEVYVILFHGGEKDQAVKMKTEEYLQALQSVKNKYPEFTYTTVDATDKDYDDLIDAISLIRSELSESPSILIMHKGNGEWIHGPQTISKIMEFAPAYKSRMDSKN